MPLFDGTSNSKLVIGLVHLKPMPGTPHYKEGDMQRSIDKAVADVTALAKGGADGCLLQTVDRVYPVADDADYARVAGMAAVTSAVRQVAPPGFKIGVQIMWNAISASLAVARVCGASYVRCVGLVGVTDSPFGMVNADPLRVLTYRRQIGAEDVGMVAEIEGMHFHWLGGKPLPDIARLAVNAGAEAVEITHPDEATCIELVRQVKQAQPKLPVILGGHTNHENAARRLANADGAFVGTCLEKVGWGGEIDVDRVCAYVDIVRGLN